jgi:surface polysaccharide O-acyltransferase-like enzyme
MITPVLRVFVKNADPALNWYLIAMCFVTSSLIKPAEDIIGFNFGVNFALLPEFTGLFLLGYQLGKMNPSNKWLAFVVVVLIASTGYTVNETYLATAERGRLVGIFYSYSMINVLLSSIALFVLLKKLGTVLSASFVNFGSIVQTISKAGFGIYLIHLIVLGLFLDGDFGFKFTAFTLQPIYSVPILAAMVFGLSFLIIIVLQKIPVLREIVPE